ncbi:MAG TPA: phosphate ABC transporter permease PstA [Candidatus Dormibacteraeota bacterium]|nr:phosphate ABC transporter permease PstA [Candidatus Dormibacteraeota bacterium]
MSAITSHMTTRDLAVMARRRRKNLLVTIVLGLAVVATLAILAWVLVYVAVRGVEFLGPDFFFKTPPGNPGTAGGGFFNGIIGSLIVVGIAALLSIPIGVAVAIFLVEYGGNRLAGAVRFFTDVLIGVPTIVTGAFVYAIWVTRFGFSGLAGAFALAIVMLPLITRTTEEILNLVPAQLREGSLGLGASRSQTVMRVTLPSALPGIITGIMLAVARAMGETAPLLLTALGNDLFVETNPAKRMSTLSLQIFGNAVTGFRASQARAWSGALTLIGIVLILTAAARFFAARSQVSR